MENDWKKTRPRKSLRKLVGRCLSFRFNWSSITTIFT
jgi:hypothetical protein